MKRNLKRAGAAMLAATMVVSQVTVTGFAAESNVEVPSVLGGETNEQVEVDITVATASNANVITAIVTPEGGDVTDSGLIVELKSEVVTDAEGNVISEDTTYKVESADGLYTAEGGTEITTKAIDPEISGDLETNLIENGNVISNATDSNELPDAGTTGDLKADDPANYDETTVTTTDRTLEVTTSEMEVTTTTPIFVDSTGKVVEIDSDVAFNYYYEDIYCIHNIAEGVCPDCGWSIGRAYFKAVDDEGNSRNIDDAGVCQRVVYNNNGTPDDPTDDEIVNGLYCVDASTGIRSDYAYRMVNLEDAVEEGYYTVEDAAHLRAIMTYGYTWNDDEDNGLTNLENIKQMIRDAKSEAEVSGDTATFDLLNKIDIDSLTRENAAHATGMAVWYYGNRYDLADDEKLVVKGGNDSVQALYEYLITLTKDADETQIIDEEKFIDDLKIVVGDKIEGNAANEDDNQDNDVYDVNLKFSLVVTPDPNSDDLLVSVKNENDEVVKTVRIAGSNKEGESYEYAATEVGEDGKNYYVIGGLQLSENSDASFNIKLEGEQQIKEGVYVFESEHRAVEDAYEICYAHWTSDENWESEKYWLEKQLSNAKAKEYGLPDNFRENVTKEAYKEYCKKIYFKTYMNEDGTWKDGSIISSQNFIGKTKGEAEVEANMNVTINFNVDEATEVTNHTWRVEAVETPTEPTPTEPVPTEPTPTEPAPTEPAPTEPAPTEPAPTESAPTEPAPTEPAPTEPAPTEPAYEPEPQFVDEPVEVAPVQEPTPVDVIEIEENDTPLGAFAIEDNEIPMGVLPATDNLPFGLAPATGTNSKALPIAATGFASLLAAAYVILFGKKKVR